MMSWPLYHLLLIFVTRTDVHAINKGLNCKLLIVNNGYCKSFRSSFLKLKVT